MMECCPTLVALVANNLRVDLRPNSSSDAGASEDQNKPRRRPCGSPSCRAHSGTENFGSCSSLILKHWHAPSSGQSNLMGLLMSTEPTCLDFFVRLLVPMTCAGIPSFFGLALEDGPVPTSSGVDSMQRRTSPKRVGLFSWLGAGNWGTIDANLLKAPVACVTWLNCVKNP